MCRLIFHARYGEFEAQVLISTGEVLNGELPRRALGLIKDWVGLHREGLEADWVRFQAGEALTVGYH